jgi:hypothetical protein
MVNTTGLLRTLASSNGSRDRECVLFCRRSSVSMSGQRRATFVVSTFEGFGLRNLTCARKADGERDCTSQCLNINSPGQLKGNIKLSRIQAFHTNSQHDTSIASQITLTSQRNGRISILRMSFLPGTYIIVSLLRGMAIQTCTDSSQAIFSMRFFHFAPSADNGSEQLTPFYNVLNNVIL